LVLVVLALASGCSGCRDGTGGRQKPSRDGGEAADDAAGGQDAGGDVGGNADGGTTSTTNGRRLPDGLAVDDAGRPILIRHRTLLGPDVEVSLVYDESLDDPITRWGDCLELVTRCFEDQPDDVDGCIDAVSVCDTNAGGASCCPQSCTQAYHDARNTGIGADRAVDQTFLVGDCVEGLAAFRDANGPPLDQVTP